MESTQVVGSAPTYLYKYCRPERIDVLEGLTIRFTQPADLNDPFELSPIINAIMPVDELRHNIENSFESDIQKALQTELEQFPTDAKKLILANIGTGKLVDPARYKHVGIEFMMSLCQKLTPSIRDVLSEKLGKLVGILSLSEVPDQPPMWAHYADEGVAL